MTRKAFLIRVKAGQEEKYRQVHEAIWPELIDAAHKAGFRNHSGFIRGQDVFLYLEAEDDFARSWQAILQEPVKAKWDTLMAPLLEPLSEGESMAFLEEVFHFD